MIKSLKEFFPRLIFSLFFVYVFLLGIINLFIASNREYLENHIANILDAQSVNIGNISNLPLIFISGTEILLKVNDELSISIEGIYFQYRFFKIFTQEFEQIPKNLQIEKISFQGHSVELKKYISHLQQKFPPSDKKISTKIDISTILSKLHAQLFVKQISVKINSMTEFWHTGMLNNLNIQIQNNTLSWNTQLKLHSIWSNLVFLNEMSIHNKGTLSNFSHLDGSIKTSIQKLNLGGLPFISTNVFIDTVISDGKPIIHIDEKSASNNNIIFSTNNGINLSLKSIINIEYDDFEEFYFLDYAFKPGMWIFDLSLSKREDWKLGLTFKSPQHPSYGLDLQLNPIKQHKTYSVLLDLQTHYFGTLRGDLILPIREGLYPLPSGSLYLDNVRFVLAGLVFSGTAVAETVSNKNEIDLKAYNVKMNNGLIGQTAVKFEFANNGIVYIHPLYHPSNSLDISSTLGSEIIVDIKAHDVDGDFVAQNIKIPIFGIKDSRYQGDINLYKKNRKSELLLNGKIKGYLDGEEQVDALLSLRETHINIPKFHILNPNILLSGDVIIDGQWSNTTISIQAQGSYNSNQNIPIDLIVDIQKYHAIVTGDVDNTISVDTYTLGNNTDFSVKFPHYNMKKLGFPKANLNTQLEMKFDANGITRFGLLDSTIKIDDRLFTLEFDTLTNTNTGHLDTTNMRFGIDKDIANGHGYFSFLNNHFEGSFRFDRGGTFQFTIGRYIVKSKLNISDLEIENIFNLAILEPLSFLKHNATENVSIRSDLNIEGPWADLNIDGNLNLTGLNVDNFQLTIPQLTWNKNHLDLKELRLRHPVLNMDTDIIMNWQNNYLDGKLKGSFAYNNNFIKSDFDFDYKKTSNIGILAYHLPNFYALSKKPINLKGKIYHNDQEYLFISDHSKYGVSGTISQKKTQNFWDVSLLNESIRLFSEGTLGKNSNLLAKLNLDVLLDKITPSGEIRSAKGKIAVKSSITGSIDNPIVNGNIDFNNLNIALHSLRNQLILTNKQSITISNNQINIPNLSINAIGGGEFGLTGLIDYQNQSIETAQLNFYSKTPRIGENTSYLTWNVDAPLLRTRGRTYISNITLSGNINELILNANIRTENLNFGLELADTLATPNDSVTVNPVLGLLESVNLDMNIDLNNRSRFRSSIFDIEFEQINPIKIQGNIGAGDIVVAGDFSVEKGNVSYLNSELKVVSGNISFSEEEGDLFPSITVNTETSQDVQSDLIDIFVNFEGKLPDLELANISSSPARAKSELLSILGAGAANSSSRNQNNSSTGARDLIASSVGIAENTLFTAPLTRRVQQLVPFIDSVQLKTDILGNITRASGSNSSAGGLGLLHGTELSVGQYIPGIKGLQASYNFRLESPNSSIDTASLNQIHQAGISLNRVIPVINWQGGVGANVRGEQNANSPSDGQVEVLLEGSLRKRF